MYCHDGQTTISAFDLLKVKRLDQEARSRAFAQRAKDAAAPKTFRGEQSQERLGWLCAVYRPASDFTVETVGDKIVVTPKGVPSTAVIRETGAGWSTDRYDWALEDNGAAIAIRQKPTAAEVVNWTSGGTTNLLANDAETVLAKRNASHEALWARWKRAQGRAA